MLHNGQTVFTAQSVGDIPHELIVFIGAVILDPVHEGDRVHDKVIMNMRVFIKMGTDKDLVAVAPDFLRQPDTDLMRDLRGDLTFGKGLVAVIGYCAVLLAEGFLHTEHIVSGGLRRAVYAPDELPLVGSILTPGVRDNVTQRIFIGVLRDRYHFRAHSFVRVLRVEQNLADIPFDPPDRCGCHYGYIASISLLTVSFSHLTFSQ